MPYSAERRAVRQPCHCFDAAHPAPESAPMVLQLSQELRRLRRCSVVKCVCESYVGAQWAVRAAQGRAACLKIEANLDACG